MSLQLEYQTLSSVQPLSTFQTQTVVECKLVSGNEFSALLGVNAVVSLNGTEVRSGELSYNAKLSLSVMYANAEGGLCRVERGAEFSQTAEHEDLAPGQRVQIMFRVVKLSARHEGTNVYLTAILQPEIEVYAQTDLRCLAGGDIVVRQEELPFYRLHTVRGEMEAEDVFEADYLSDILLHTESVLVREAVCGHGQVTVTGDVALELCTLKGEETAFFERLIPFRAELPCEEAFPKCPAEAVVSVRAVKLSADTDEEKGKSALSAIITLDLFAKVYEQGVLHGVTDAFSTQEELSLVRAERSFSYPASMQAWNERLSGVAALSDRVDFTCTTEGIVGAAFEGTCQKTASGVQIDGLVTGNLLVRDGTEGMRSIEFTLPCTVEERMTVTGPCRVSGIVCGLMPRQKREGEVELEGTLKLTVVSYAEERAEFLVDAQSVAPIPPAKSAISVYIPRAGEDLWETAKRLHRPPEEVQRDNPELTFPLTGKERIFVYRQNRIAF